MSILATELIAYGAASVPTDDTSTTGGAIDTTSRPAVTQLTANARLAFVSDGADVRTGTAVFRDATGLLVTEVITLNGTTEVLSTATAERFISFTLAATSSTRTVTVKQGSGGTTLCTVAVNETKRFISFANAVSAGTTKIRYEKVFWKSTTATLTLNSANVTLTSDPSATIQIGLDTAVNATTSAANRLTAPVGVTFSDDNIAISVPGGVVAAASAIGTWIQQMLGANAAPAKSSYTTQLAGTSV